MKKIDKFLSHLAPNERQRIERLLDKIIKSDLEGLDIKKTERAWEYISSENGADPYYILQSESIIIIRIEKRNDTTYTELS